MRPCVDRRLVNGRTYDTETALLIADNDCRPDDPECPEEESNLFLFRTPDGFYFTQSCSRWGSAADGHVEPVDLQQALHLYEEELMQHHVPYAGAFPDIETG
ncbi:MAG: hypothetical protein JXA57_18945 [Armatimonadetes bacterium]|nr:hypothetical protein [Armatimonadota bacterium]